MAFRIGEGWDIHALVEGRKLMLVFEHRMVDLVADRVGEADVAGRIGGDVVLQPAQHEAVPNNHF